MIAANHGMVVTVASLAAYVPAPNMVDYAASKSAALAFHEGLAGELRANYEANRVRTVVVTQGYTKTPLFEGFSTGNGFLMPALQPQTVAEELVRKVLGGRSGQVVLPRMSGWISLLRGLPGWLQNGIRGGDGVRKGMAGWRGRLVMDPEERYQGEMKGKEKGEKGKEGGGGGVEEG